MQYAQVWISAFFDIIDGEGSARKGRVVTLVCARIYSTDWTSVLARGIFPKREKPVGLQYSGASSPHAASVATVSIYRSRGRVLETALPQVRDRQ